MIVVLTCIAADHNPWLVLLGFLVCGFGSFATLQLFRRTQMTRGVQKLAWIFMSSIMAGTAIWCTHFIGMLAYTAATAVAYDPVLTSISLLVAIGGANLGITIATRRTMRLAPLAGGAIMGAGISAMHYIGMLAFRVDGVVNWSPGYVVASVVLAVVLAAAAMEVATHVERDRVSYTAAGLFGAAILGLHFTGMAALRVTPILGHVPGFDRQGMIAMAIVTTLVAAIVLGAGAFTYIIDQKTRHDRDDQLRTMAARDTLTGLPNRATFAKMLLRDMLHVDAVHHKLALISIDLDAFDDINDRYGHQIGDRVLRCVGERMAGDLGGDERVARLGGDEFGAIKTYGDPQALRAFVARLETMLSAPVLVGDEVVAIGASIGIAVYPDDAVDPDLLANNAALARNRPGTQAGTGARFYDRATDERSRERRALAADLRLAIERGQLSMVYQVQTRLADGDICGYEALLRWTHHEFGPVSPADFIPIAEESDLILTIGEWVLNTACADAANWAVPCKVAVNMSPIQLMETDLAQIVHGALVRSGLSPRLLELELTESAIMQNRVRALHVLRHIKALGVRLALDDFGTGYSSLEVLGSFPFDKIKLDRHFVTPLETSQQSLAILRLVLALGKSLAIPVLAEGIETPQQLAILRAEGCQMGQGYLLGRPAPNGDIDSGARGDGPVLRSAARRAL